MWVELDQVGLGWIGLNFMNVVNHAGKITINKFSILDLTSFDGRLALHVHKAA